MQAGGQQEHSQVVGHACSCVNRQEGQQAGIQVAWSADNCGGRLGRQKSSQTYRQMRQQASRWKPGMQAGLTAGKQVSSQAGRRESWQASKYPDRKKGLQARRKVARQAGR